MTFVDASDPPFLLLHGKKRQHLSRRTVAAHGGRVNAVGVAHFVEFSGVDRSWIGRSAAETRAAHLRPLQATFDFFDVTIGRK